MIKFLKNLFTFRMNLGRAPTHKPGTTEYGNETWLKYLKENNVDKSTK
jgi:hypothetical protein